MGVPISCWVATSQSRTLPSLPAVASLVPSGLNVTTVVAGPAAMGLPSGC